MRIPFCVYLYNRMFQCPDGLKKLASESIKDIIIKRKNSSDDDLPDAFEI